MLARAHRPMRWSFVVDRCGEKLSSTTAMRTWADEANAGSGRTRGTRCGLVGLDVPVRPVGRGRSRRADGGPRAAGCRSPADAAAVAVRISWCRRRPPLRAGMGLQVERPELIDADHHGRIARPGLGLAVGDVVQLEDPVLLDFEVGVVGLRPRLHRLKRHALLAEQNPQALMADVVDHPLATRCRPAWSATTSRTAGRSRAGDPAILIWRRCGSVNVGGRPPA